MALKKEDIIIIEPKEMFVGKKDAPVTLIEFGEYENEDCAKVNEVVKQILEEYDGRIRFQFRHFPLTLIHQRSLKFLEDLVNGTWGWQVQDDIKEGHNRGVKEIPAFFINDVMLTVKPSFANLSAAIDLALKKTKSKPAAKKAAAKPKQRA